MIGDHRRPFRYHKLSVWDIPRSSMSKSANTDWSPTVRLVNICMHLRQHIHITERWNYKRWGQTSITAFKMDNPGPLSPTIMSSCSWTFRWASGNFAAAMMTTLIADAVLSLCHYLVKHSQ